MQNLTKAHEQLFMRTNDECFASLQQLWERCYRDREQSQELWPQPDEISLRPVGGELKLVTPEDATRSLTKWSFSQLCQLAGVNRDTVNRLSAPTAAQVFEETLAPGTKPMQLYTTGDQVRAVHGASYTRLYNVDLLNVVREFATDFQPAQQAGSASDTGGTGLYCGEQDMFCFLIDPTGWTEIEGEAFAPGFFLWNSEVGRRSIGMQTFWFQAVCQNHIVWDAVEVVDYSRKHTANVHDSLREIRMMIEQLVAKRDARRDGFAEMIRRAMTSRLADSADEALALLNKQGITKTLAKEALELARERGGFTVFAVVDALTRLAGRMKNAGDRTEADARAAGLLALA